MLFTFICTYSSLSHSRSKFKVNERLCARRGFPSVLYLILPLETNGLDAWGRHWRFAGAAEPSPGTESALGQNNTELPPGSCCVWRETAWLLSLLLVLFVECYDAVLSVDGSALERACHLPGLPIQVYFFDGVNELNE